MNFGEAMEFLKISKALARKGWNGKGMFVEKTPLYTPEDIRIDNDCLILYNVNGLYNTWVPSITDLFAEDWEVVEKSTVKKTTF